MGQCCGEPEEPRRPRQKPRPPQPITRETYCRDPYCQETHDIWPIPAQRPFEEPREDRLMDVNVWFRMKENFTEEVRERMNGMVRIGLRTDWFDHEGSWWCHLLGRVDSATTKSC